MVTADNVSDVTNSWELVKAFGLQEAGVAFFLKIVRRAPRRRRAAHPTSHLAAPRLSPTAHAPLIQHCSRASQFEIAPGALELFSFKGDKDDLANSEKLKGHALKVRRRHAPSAR